MKTTILAILALVLMSEVGHAKHGKIKKGPKLSSDSEITIINLEDMKDINTTFVRRDRSRR